MLYGEDEKLYVDAMMCNKLAHNLLEWEMESFYNNEGTGEKGKGKIENKEKRQEVRKKRGVRCLQHESAER